ncbi:hypothetical protein [Pontibacter ruber]|uniref:Uncharacterized protein n=1 Tax=Pontibacter ruber TaxID=1343895 RepID=A0ABW5CXA6_9BACT|nr:hypothetical protein [Pontibacter ruber]
MNQNLINTILLSLAFVVIVIGIHRSIEEADIAGNYWIFMVSFVLFIIYRHRKKKNSA